MSVLWPILAGKKNFAARRTVSVLGLSPSPVHNSVYWSLIETKSDSNIPAFPIGIALNLRSPSNPIQTQFQDGAGARAQPCSKSPCARLCSCSAMLKIPCSMLSMLPGAHNWLIFSLFPIVSKWEYSPLSWAKRNWALINNYSFKNNLKKKIDFERGAGQIFIN